MNNETGTKLPSFSSNLTNSCQQYRVVPFGSEVISMQDADVTKRKDNVIVMTSR